MKILLNSLQLAVPLSVAQVARQSLVLACTRWQLRVAADGQFCLGLSLDDELSLPDVFYHGGFTMVRKIE